MTNKPMLSVERDLIERAVQAIINTSQMQPALNELRALLDKPAKHETCKRCDGECVIHTGIEESPTTLCNHCDGSGNEPAAQHQGEPVAYQIRRRTGREDSAWTKWQECSEMERAMHSHEVGKYNRFGIMREIRALYAEQPAPVAVVMPERMKRITIAEEPDTQLRMLEQIERNGFNKALEAIARLNGVRP